jgi:sulfate adenylyltransferase
LTEDNVQLIEPYGGELVNLVVSNNEREELRRQMMSLPRLQLTTRNICDLELLASGAFSPLDRFMTEADYQGVVTQMRLSSGELFPLPITLSVAPTPDIKPGFEVTLVDQYNNPLALMRVEEIYRWDREAEARLVFGSTDLRHPLIAEMHEWGEVNISGPLKVLALPRYHDFVDLRLTPVEVRARLARLGCPNVVAFQTRNPLHRAHEEMTKRAAERINGTLLLHPVVGMTKPGDINHYARVRTYKVLAERYYDHSRMLLSLLPLAMRMAGPREALMHAIIRRNYGANHLVVGRDHASPGLDSGGVPFYGPYAAQEMFAEHSDEIGVKPVAFAELLYMPDEDRYEEATRLPAGKHAVTLSGTQVREDYLQRGRTLPRWFTRPEVAAILSEMYPPRHRQGFCLWFTGLSGAGKSTTAGILLTKLLEHGRQVSLLDGDVVRLNLSKGLGFSKEDRDINVRRIGYVASEIVRHSGAVICAAVSPYRAARNECRAMVGNDRFIEIYVDTPLEVCAERDTKGMYAMAMAGKIENFTGISDPYEQPLNPEIVLDTIGASAEENADRIIDYLVGQGLLRPLSAACELEEAGSDGLREALLTRF